MVTALHSDRLATAVGGRTIGLRCVEQGEVPHPGIHPHHTGHRTDREDHQAASHTSSREEEGKVVASSSRKALPTRRKEAPLPRRLYTHLNW